MTFWLTRFYSRLRMYGGTCAKKAHMPHFILELHLRHMPFHFPEMTSGRPESSFDISILRSNFQADNNLLPVSHLTSSPLKLRNVLTQPDTAARGPLHVTSPLHHSDRPVLYHSDRHFHSSYSSIFTCLKGGIEFMLSQVGHSAAPSWQLVRISPCQQVCSLIPNASFHTDKTKCYVIVHEDASCKDGGV